VEDRKYNLKKYASPSGAHSDIKYELQGTKFQSRGVQDELQVVITKKEPVSN